MIRRLLLILLLALPALAVDVGPLPFVKQQFFDNNGAPLAGGYVCTYQAGTLIPLSTYTDSTGLVANTNPVHLDAAGRAAIWLGPSSYKIVLQGPDGAACAGTILWTQDGVVSFGSYLSKSGGAVVGDVSITGHVTIPIAGDLTVWGNITSTDGALSAKTTITGPIQDKGGQCYNVKAYGAVGDGAANDATAINAAIAALPAGGGTICMPAGKYRITSPITVNVNGKPALIQGAGNGATIIKADLSSGTGAVVFNYGEYIAELPSPGLQSAGLRDLSIVKVGAIAYNGLEVGGTLGASGATFSNILISGFSNNILLGDKLQEVSFDHCNIGGGTRLVDYQGSADSGEKVVFQNCTFHNAGTPANAIFSDATGNAFRQHLSFINCQFDYGSQIYAKNGIIDIAQSYFEWNVDDYYIVIDTDAVLNLTDSTFSKLAAATTKALIDVKSAGDASIVNLTGKLSLAATAYRIVNAEAGSRVSIMGAATTNDGGFWSTPPHTGTGAVSLIVTAPSNITNGYSIFNKAITLGPTTVGTLPAAANCVYCMISVSDSTAVASEGQACTGGAGVKALAFSDGATWKCF